LKSFRDKITGPAFEAEDANGKCQAHFLKTGACTHNLWPSESEICPTRGLLEYQIGESRHNKVR